MEKGVKRMKDGMLRIGWIGAGGVNFGGVDPVRTVVGCVIFCCVDRRDSRELRGIMQVD